MKNIKKTYKKFYKKLQKNSWDVKVYHRFDDCEEIRISSILIADDGTVYGLVPNRPITCIRMEWEIPLLELYIARTAIGTEKPYVYGTPTAKNVIVTFLNYYNDIKKKIVTLNTVGVLGVIEDK